ncbi:MAG TPA: CoA transferase [Phenylobacterium sp.]|jgi:crotonobetainyl-CoA:carnitine CoA-transferase CaiB-like acyl-CoA transferase|uniref:CaiB/BaiF CoA transferase family protein n=1 Tax=Phenylobacterium sp. TaxID=1871053 RepID=UPI002D48FA1D|nr:CoA transferase [Phenylobacterium sp.]HZZ67854.1 CoA transferase [Phenylobacterium sp.]
MPLLSDLKVVEWSTWIAGPGCAAVMADWGAQVIKVESAAGDATRTFWPDTAECPGNPIFSNENRGKRGVVLDVGKAEGRAALITILQDADVFITNVRPGALKRARLDYDSLKDELPALIYANVTGYGLTGADVDTPAFDLTGFWNRSGVASAINPPDREPIGSRPGFGDHVTALATLSGVLAAVHERARTGRGRQVETALMRVGCYALGWDMSIKLRNGEALTAQPRHTRPGAIAGYFRTKDERWICVSQRGPNDFPQMMRAVGRADLIEQPRCAAPIVDMAVVHEIRDLLDRVFEALTLEEACAMMKTTDIIFAPMASLDDVIADPQAQEAGCFVDMPDGWGGSFKAPAAPVRFPATATGPAGPAPKLGEHTRQVLAEAGYGQAEVDALIAAGAAS